MANDMERRRSTAAQFFLEDEQLSQSYNKIVAWLTKASLLVNSGRKTDYLKRIQETIMGQNGSLLDNFLDEILSFQGDASSNVRKFIAGFIAEACKKDHEVLPKVITNFSMLLQDPSVQVQKRMIQLASHVYREALMWVSRAKSITEEMETTWGILGNIKTQIIGMVDSDNDGIRTYSVKFLERVVLLQTYSAPDSMHRESDFSLEDMPITVKLSRRRKLEEEANIAFDLLIKFHGSQHISNVNLMTCMSSLTLIAKMRPQFMGRVITAIETLHKNLPPTLTKSQVNSVRKHMKMQLLNLLKHPSVLDYHTNITNLLTDLGTSCQEITKSYLKLGEMRKHKRLAEKTIIGPDKNIKKPRLDVDDYDDEDDDDDDDDDDYDDIIRVPVKSSQWKPTDLPVDVSEQYIADRLTPNVAAELVITSMAQLPDRMPTNFTSVYKPVGAVKTHILVKHVAWLMAMQFNSKNSSFDDKMQTPFNISTKEDTESLKKLADSSANFNLEKNKGQTSRHFPTTILPKVIQKRPKTLRLSEVIKPLASNMASKMLVASIQRILKAERDAVLGGVANIRTKVITTLAATFNKDVREEILNYILQDLRLCFDLGFAWLYEEYTLMQGFNQVPTFLKQEQDSEENYNFLLCSIANNIIEHLDVKDQDILLGRLYLEAPMITEEATEILKGMCQDESRSMVGLKLLQDLVIKRPPRQLVFLNSLLEYTSYENPAVRDQAIQIVLELYDRGDLCGIIEDYAIFYLGFLRQPHPPDMLFGLERGRPHVHLNWTEDTVKVCLYLYLALLPINEKLIHELARVYVQTVADVKRTILRLLKQPVCGMGMDSPQLLTLVEECPKGAETLVTRVIHILTDQNPPSVELVARVRDLYHTRVSDVRFLIPVLNGLTKKEVIAALPKLIKLNPVVVKEVFNRLLGTHTEGVSHTSPVTPAELLIALHNIDTSKCELKTVIKATSLCFAEKQAYTQEVLAVVMQNLMELSPLPTLLMRTVLQSLSLYPRLIGFVMNILQRLIMKQVWKQKKVWEGFIKCCQRTMPQSFQVLLQLPPPQLKDVLDNTIDLQKPLLSHVMSFTENQRAHIPQSMMDILIGNTKPILIEYDSNMDPLSPSELRIDIKEEPEDFSQEPAPPGMD